jgi:hypothetical protein
MYAPVSTTAAEAVYAFVTRGWKGSTTSAATEFMEAGMVVARFEGTVDSTGAVTALVEVADAAWAVDCPRRTGMATTRDAPLGCTATMQTDAKTAREAAAAAGGRNRKKARVSDGVPQVEVRFRRSLRVRRAAGVTNVKGSRRRVRGYVRTTYA